MQSELVRRRLGPPPVHATGARKTPPGTYWLIQLHPSPRMYVYWCDLLADDGQDTFSTDPNDAAKFKSEADARAAFAARGRTPLPHNPKQFEWSK